MIVILVTTSDNAVRKTLEFEQGITLITIDCAVAKDNTLQLLEEYMNNVTPDILITYRCPYILPQDIFSLPRLGAFNIHPSLLPKYPGLNPWEAIFRIHEREGGVTLHQITKQVDAGSIVFQRSFRIEETDTLEIARMKADRLAAELVEQLISKICCQSSF